MSNYNSNDFMCNVLVMGKTGTGKSSLLNYLANQKIAKTGTGKPVTEEGIYDYEVTLNDQYVRIFDSWGIEAGKVDKWMNLITRSLQDHGIAKPMEEWFHVAVYCIQAGGSRVEDIDTQIIRKFLTEGYHLVIVLTKADQVDEESEKELKEIIFKEIRGIAAKEKKGLVKIIASCAEELVIRGGGKTKPFGQKEIKEAILLGWKDTIIERLPKRTIYRLKKLLDTEQREPLLEEIKKIEVGAFAEMNTGYIEEIRDIVKDATKDLIEKDLPRVLKEELEKCRKINLSIKKLFDINIDTSSIDNAANALFSEARKQGFWNLFFSCMTGGLSSFFRMFSRNKKDTQRKVIERFCSEAIEAMKKELDKMEDKLTKIVADALG